MNNRARAPEMFHSTIKRWIFIVLLPEYNKVVVLNAARTFEHWVFLVLGEASTWTHYFSHVFLLEIYFRSPANRATNDQETFLAG